MEGKPCVCDPYRLSHTQMKKRTFDSDNLQGQQFRESFKEIMNSGTSISVLNIVWK